MAAGRSVDPTRWLGTLSDVMDPGARRRKVPLDERRRPKRAADRPDRSPDRNRAGHTPWPLRLPRAAGAGPPGARPPASGNIGTAVIGENDLGQGVSALGRDCGEALGAVERLAAGEELAVYGGTALTRRV
ncbi:hypothetical protein GCM10009574_084600 [Streptomyces asiaticus]|uniref:Uncharacterized protein n=2 Tax=Streptomyces rhizosphaericus TaxID=114699 RepID=A0ABN1SI63_9ACTN